MSESIADQTVLNLSDRLKLFRQPISLAQSVVQRQNVRFAPSGSSSYNPQTNKVITIRLSSQDYIDGKTSFLYFTYAADLVGTIPQDCCLSFFDSAKLSVGGRVLEQISNFDSIAPSIFYAKHSADVINGSIGQLAGANKHRFTKGGWCQIGTGSGAAAATALNYLGSGTASVPGMDSTSTNSLNYVPEGGQTSSTRNVIQNSSNFLAGYGHTMVPALQNCYMKSAASEVDSGYLKAGNSTRVFAVPLGAIFGFFNIQDSYIPARNLGVIEIVLTLGSKGVLNICPLDQAVGTAGTPLFITDTTSAAAVDLAAGKANYSLSNVFVSTDCVSPNPALLQKIDQMTMSDEGISLVYDTISVSQYSQPYETSMSIQVSRSYSHVRDIYATFRVGTMANSIFARNDQTVLGTRVRSSRVVVGSSVFPSQECDSAAQAYVQFLTAFGHHEGYVAPAVDFASFIGATGLHGNNIAFTGQLPNVGVVKAGGVPALVQASQSFSEAPSSYMLCQSFERVLGEGSNNLSGISTRLSGSIVNLDVRLKATDDAEFTNAHSYDCIVGTAGLLVSIGIHSECLLKVANSAVLVAD